MRGDRQRRRERDIVRLLTLRRWVGTAFYGLPSLPKRFAFLLVVAFSDRKPDSTLDLSFFAQPAIDSLVERTQTPCNLAMLDKDEIIYVLRSSTTHGPAAPTPLNVGRRFPAYVTSMGRVLLGALPPEELDTCKAGVRVST
jgi:DNA-binding IclR family transcriptional regulator